MTPDELRAAMERLGMSTTQMAAALRLGKGGDSTVRKWLRGDRAISGTTATAVELMCWMQGTHFSPSEIDEDQPKFQIQIRRGSGASEWWETITSLEIKRRGGGFKTQDEAWDYAREHMADVNPNSLRIISEDPSR